MVYGVLLFFLPLTTCILALIKRGFLNTLYSLQAGLKLIVCSLKSSVYRKQSMKLFLLIIRGISMLLVLQPLFVHRLLIGCCE